MGFLGRQPLDVASSIRLRVRRAGIVRYATNRKTAAGEVYILPISHRLSEANKFLVENAPRC